MKGLSQYSPWSRVFFAVPCHLILPPISSNTSFFKLPWFPSPCLQQSTFVPLVHFYYQTFFAVPNSQTSSGSQSLWSIVFLTSLAPPCCWMRMGQGKDTPRAIVSLTTDRGCKGMVTWAVIPDLCAPRFLSSIFIPEQGCLVNLSECTIQLTSMRHLYANPTSALGLSV